MDRRNKRIQTEVGKIRSSIIDLIHDEGLRDGLTDLGNDLALEEALEAAFETGRRFWLAFLEIDHFKRLNDEYGYQNADAVLVKLASILDECHNV